jgi:ABC-type phosphate transport system permease subunit
MATSMLRRRPDQQPGYSAGAGARHARDRVMTIVLAVVVAVAVAVLVWVLAHVAAQGFKYLGPAFFTHTPTGNPASYGGGLPTASSEASSSSGSRR